MSDWSAVLGQAVDRARRGDPGGGADFLWERFQDPDLEDRALLEGGRFLAQAGRPEPAVQLLDRLLARAPGNVAALNDAAIALLALGRAQDALERIDRLVGIQPDAAFGHYNRGNALRALGRMAEAREAFRTASELAPRDPNCLNNLAMACMALEDPEGAAAALQALLRLSPGALEPRGLLAQVAAHLGHYGLALETLLEGLRHHPGQPKLHLDYAMLLQSIGLHDQARPHFDALRRSLRDPGQQSSLLFASLNDPALPPSQVFELHREWARRFADPLAPGAGPEAVLEEGRPLRVGLVSPDLHSHPVAAFLEPFLRHHDPAALELTVYSTCPGGDEVTRRIQAQAPRWRDLSRLDADAALAQVRQDRIQILIDLAGHTGGALLELFARRAAPLQATWLGYPGSTGMRAMDLRISDPVADPDGAESLHSERLLRIPGGFLCFPGDAAAPPPGPLPARATGSVTFGCFNKLSKLNGPVLDLWAAILRRLPASRLLLKAAALADAGVCAHWRQGFEERGVPAGRVELLGRTPTRAEHLALYDRMDIGLDPFPYNGTTTTCEALWMGVPVVALRGSSHVARMGASLLTHAGLEDWIAESAAGYVELAAAKATDLQALAAVRSGLRARMQGTLADAPGFARRFERALQEAWRAHCGAGGATSS